MSRDELTGRLKEMVQKAGPVKIMIVIVSGILLLLLSCGDFSTANKVENTGDNTRQTETQMGDDLRAYQNIVQEQVKNILEQVDGVGSVDVMITLRASKEKVTLKDSTVNQEKREEESVLIEDENKNTSPYVIQELEPELEGILVVCDGGDSPTVQREIIGAVSALFPVESHKIKVMKSKEAE